MRAHEEEHPEGAEEQRREIPVRRKEERDEKKRPAERTPPDADRPLPASELAGDSDYPGRD